MCSPKTPAVNTTVAPAVNTTVAEPIAAPTYADADVQKAGTSTRQQQQAATNKNIKTTALGITEDATTKKKTLLGE